VTDEVDDEEIEDPLQKTDLRLSMPDEQFMRLINASSPPGVEGKGQRTLTQLKHYYKNIKASSTTRHSGNDPKIAMRMAKAPMNHCIDWHVDGDYASATMQVALNEPEEYVGGRLCFFQTSATEIVPDNEDRRFDDMYGGGGPDPLTRDQSREKMKLDKGSSFRQADFEQHWAGLPKAPPRQAGAVANSTLNPPEDRLECLERFAGSIVTHPKSVLHGVSRLTEGTRKSLFVVNQTNGLGEGKVVCVEQKDVDDFLRPANEITSDTPGTCCLCRDEAHPASVVCIPCMHVCICKHCFNEQPSAKALTHCPICRQGIAMLGELKYS